LQIQTEVLIVGGGVVGVGISRDLSLRQIPCLLVEKGDFATGASGRNHGLFHSGARYAVSDPEAARECIAENRILQRIAPHCIEETGGLFISLQEDGLDFRDQFLQACDQAGIPAALLSRDEALALEPELNPDLLSAVKVPDGAIDPFTLILENVREGESHGAKFLLHTEITSLVLDGSQAKGAMAVDLISGEKYSIKASYIINSTGAWVNQFLKFAGLHVDMALSKGSMLITNQRLNQRVLNRCRAPSDADIVVPNQTVSILGTTSVRPGGFEDFEVSSGEISLLINETSKMIPAIPGTRFIRAYAGIRPLFQSVQGMDGRAVSRGFALIDHGRKEGLQNLVTIVGGKLVTYRLMAEKASDLICQKMGTPIPCSTHLKPLPGAGNTLGPKDKFKRIGQTSSQDGAETLCDCEMIGKEEVEGILKESKLRDLQDILHRTRLAKGTCQGGFCIYRLLGIIHDLKMTQANPNRALKDSLEERWRGIRPILWGTSLKEEELIESIYKGIFNL
jgi:glycerol-3-phosphate dehydrogenase